MTKNKFKNTDVADSFHLNEDCAFYCWQFFSVLFGADGREI